MNIIKAGDRFEVNTPTGTVVGTVAEDAEKAVWAFVLDSGVMEVGPSRDDIARFLAITDAERR